MQRRRVHDILGKASVAQTDLIEEIYEAKKQVAKKLIKGEMGGDLEWAMLLHLERCAQPEDLSWVVEVLPMISLPCWCSRGGVVFRLNNPLRCCDAFAVG